MYPVLPRLSWIDHCISTPSCKYIVSNVSDFTTIFYSTFIRENRSICKWHLSLDDDKLKHSHRTNYLLFNIELATDALLCRNTSCTRHSHAIDCFYINIINSLKSAESECIPSTSGASTSHIIPGWHDYVKEYHIAARYAFWWWNINNRPRHGIIYHNMRTSRSQF